MRTAALFLLIFLAVPLSARAGEWFAPLGKTDLAMLAVDTALLGVDWAQSRYVAANPDNWHETNVLLGPHPSVQTVNKYFAAVIALYWLTTWMLPPKEDHGYKRIVNRQYFSVAITITEGACVGNNARIGIGMKF